MTDVRLTDPDPESPAGVAGPPTERRRPGRVAYTNPALIEVLRTPHAASSGVLPASLEEPDPEDPLTAAKGIALAMLVGVVLWGAALLAVWETVRFWR